MIKKFLLLIAIFCFIKNANAQTVSQVTGSVKDTSSNIKVKNAVVSLLTPKDSVLAGFARVKEDGNYTIQNIKPGKYILVVTHPLFADFVDDIKVNDANEKISRIALTSKSKLLEAVIVKSGNPIKLRGDTTVYTADSFKVSANANVEELLKKMPGIQVDKDGKIKAMGETVEKVLVDGEEFFGDDPGMAVKNLRADAVKEVQVFDKKSEQAEFTGIDDGKTKKTINLKLKEDKKHGYFGKVDVAGGLQKKIEDRYNDNILLSSFKGKRKISGFVLNGNTGQDGLSWQDEQKFGGGSDNMVVDEDAGFSYYDGSRGSDEEVYINPQNGFLTSVNAGIQYSNKAGEKSTINISPKYNRQSYDNTNSTYSKTLLNGDSSLNENSLSAKNINRYNFKARAILETKLDSTNTLKLTGNTNFYHVESEEKSFSSTTDQSGLLRNSSSKIYETQSDKTALSGNLVFKHKFKTARRTFSINADWKNQQSNGKNYLQSSNFIKFDNSTQLIDQMKDFDKTTTDFTSKFIYTEPLGKKYALELGYQIGFDNGNNNQTTFTKAPGTNKYESKVDSLSNYFKQNIVQHTPSAKINYSYKKFKINAGAGIALTNFEFKDLSLNKNYNRNYTNFFPSAGLNYSYKASHNLRINYNGNTRQPTLNQLQPLRVNDNLFNQYIGNPDLKPSFSNNFSISHNSYNFIKDVWTYQSLNVSLTNNSITNNRIINYNTGATTTQPINTNGNVNVNFWGGTGFKVKKIDTRFFVNANGGYSKYADVINSIKTFSENLNAGTSFDISKSKEKKYDVNFSENLDFNRSKTFQSNSNIKYITNRVSFNGTVYYKKVWSLKSDYELFYRQKTAQAPAFNNSLWNARLQRTFKKDEFTAYISIRDILNQNTGLDRNFDGNTFTETRNERLQRYWMLGFTWNFKNKAVKAK